MAELASSRGWGPGWPNPHVDHIVTAVCGANRVKLPVRTEIAVLVQRLVADLEHHHGPFHPGQCWGFANRAIRGSSTPSNHSWGLAIDLDAPSNPMTSNPGAPHTIGSYASGVAARYGFRWGGDYVGRKDYMHFEFMGTPASAAALVRGVRGVVGPVAPASGRPALPGAGLRRGSAGQPVRWLQSRLNQIAGPHGHAVLHGKPLAVDGIFGPLTEQVVKAFQAQRHLAVDGVVGPRTWAQL
jgi:peptidoglycan hydrolase-like protein with peptidoglycan-binding domain